MNFVVGGDGLALNLEAVIVAGFTGRDPRKVAAHVQELAAEGVQAPDDVPSFYLAPPDVAQQTDMIVATHEATSGEAEIALLIDGNETYVSLASDHTDRAAEAVAISLSKLVCPKVLAREAWLLSEVRDHWDEIEIRSWISENGKRVLYQEGSAGELLAPEELLRRTPFGRRPRRFLILTGTIAARGGVRGSKQFWAELHDPRLNRTIRLSYRVKVIADVLDG